MDLPASSLQEMAKANLWMHFTRLSSYKEQDVPVITRGEGCYVYDSYGKRYLDGLSALFCVNAGHGRAEIARRDGRAGQGARLLHHLELRPPGRDRALGQDRVADPGRPQPRVLHLRRRRVGRVRAQARAPLPQEERRARPVQGRSRARSPTTAPPWARSSATGIPDLRAPFEPLAAGSAPRAEHQQLPLARGPRPALGGRRDRGADPVRGAGDRVGRDPRAGPERRRLLHAARRATGSGSARSATSTASC